MKALIPFSMVDNTLLANLERQLDQINDANDRTQTAWRSSAPDHMTVLGDALTDMAAVAPYAMALAQIIQSLRDSPEISQALNPNKVGGGRIPSMPTPEEPMEGGGK